MTMELRGKAAVVGIGETPHRRVWPGRTMWGLCAEAAAEAIKDAGLTREDIENVYDMLIENESKIIVVN